MAVIALVAPFMPTATEDCACIACRWENLLLEHNAHMPKKKKKKKKKNSQSHTHTQRQIFFFFWERGRGGGGGGSPPVYELLCLSLELDYLVSWLFVV
jgi:hypothetical protein